MSDAAPAPLRRSDALPSVAVPGSVQSIERAAAILQVVAGADGQLGVTDIAGAVGLAKTTTHSLLRTLLLVGFVEQDRVTGRYAVGAGLLRLGTGALDANELRARSSNWADALASRSGQAVRLATLVGDQVVVVHHVFRPDDSAQVLDVGTSLPARSTALGKVLLAFAPHLPRAARASARSGSRGNGSTTSVAASGGGASGPGVGLRPSWAAELTEIRSRGWATAYGEHQPGVGAVAAPVRGATGLVVAALGLAGPLAAVFDGQGRARGPLVTMVTDAAQAVSRELGHHG
jgi:DNA-binding IclR family transcriptional regulator